MSKPINLPAAPELTWSARGNRPPIAPMAARRPARRAARDRRSAVCSRRPARIPAARLVAGTEGRPSSVCAEAGRMEAPGVDLVPVRNVPCQGPTAVFPRYWRANRLDRSAWNVCLRDRARLQEPAPRCWRRDRGIAHTYVDEAELVGFLLRRGRKDRLLRQGSAGDLLLAWVVRPHSNGYSLVRRIVAWPWAGP